MTISSILKVSPDALRIKTFEYNRHTFKVKIPTSKELENITSAIINIPKEEIDARFNKMTASLIDAEIEGVEITDDDVIVEGRSSRETCRAVAQMEKKVVEYFKFLVPENGSLADIKYEDIEAEFPLQIQFDLLDKISEVIQPGYKEARKN